MGIETGSRIRLVLAAGLQVLGVLGTSYTLDFILRRTPGFAASRAAHVFELGTPLDGLTFTGELLRNAIVPATVEELFFRGLVYEGLRRTLGGRAALVGSALLFGLAHLGLHHGLAATLLGLQLGALRRHFGLALAIAAHALNNGAALMAARGGLESSATGLAFALVISFGACAALVQRSRTESRAEGSPGAP